MQRWEVMLVFLAVVLSIDLLHILEAHVHSNALTLIDRAETKNCWNTRRLGSDIKPAWLTQVRKLEMKELH